MPHCHLPLVCAAGLACIVPTSVLAQPPAARLRQLGGEPETAIVSVDFGGSRKCRTSEGMRAIVEELKPLPHLRTLHLSPFVNDSGLKELGSLGRLEGLHLLASQTTDAGLKHISRLQELRTLQLTRTRISDEGLAHISKLKHLRDLDISIAAITDHGLNEVARMSGLTRLDISGLDGISDAGMQSVAKLANHRVLWVYNTKVTDDGLKALASLKHLEELRIFRTGVTDAGVQSFKNAVPDCHVRWKVATSPRNDSGQ